MRSNQKPPTVGDDRRTQTIYRLAAEVIHKKGFDATSMGDIADAVDLTKGGLYYYIKGKQALLFAIMNEALKLLESEVVEPAAEESDPEHRLAVLISGHVRLVMQETAVMTILATERDALDAKHRAKLADCTDDYPGMLRDCIERILIQKDSAARVDPAVAAHCLLGMVHWVVRWQRTESQMNEDQLVEQLTNLALYGIIPLPAAAHSKIA